MLLFFGPILTFKQKTMNWQKTGGKQLVCNDTDQKKKRATRRNRLFLDKNVKKGRQ